MVIVYIANASSIHTIRWIKYFAKKDVKIYLISFSKPNHVTTAEINKIKLNVKLLFFNNLVEIFKTIIFLSNIKNALIHIHYLGWHSLLSIFIKKENKLILTPWGSDLLKNRNFLKDIWLKLLFKKAAYVICDSKRLLKESIKLGIKKERTFICMFGVDTDSYKYARKIFSNKKFFIGSNRNLETIYDVITFIKAANIICKTRKDIYFYIAGDGSLKEKYKQYVKSNKISKNIIFLGLLNIKEMLDFYNNIDIYISTSLSDGGLSASVAEAMSFERLVIISNNSDNKLWVKDGINGYLFDSGDYIDLSKKIINAIKNKKNSMTISNKSRELIEKNYSYKKEMQKVYKIYKMLFN